MGYVKYYIRNAKIRINGFWQLRIYRKYWLPFYSHYLDWNFQRLSRKIEKMIKKAQPPKEK